ncbi:MAG: hypothetical protein APF78_06090 [Sphingomonadales bacterium BRH_c3]|nr:MAG: hypothetical protein APF78_06090 [Sphingomonadales bacterium BRH_c3]
MATRLFLEEGYGAATTNELVARVGGSKSTIYSHFENKEKLFGAVVDHVLAQLKAATGRFGAPCGDVQQQLCALGEGLLEIVLSKDHIALARMVIGESHRFPEIGAIYHEHGPVLAQEGVVTFLLEHQVMPMAGTAEVDEAAEWFTGRLIHRAFIRALCGPATGLQHSDEAARIARETAESFIRYFARPAAGGAK